MLRWSSRAFAVPLVAATLTWAWGVVNAAYCCLVSKGGLYMELRESTEDFFSCGEFFDAIWARGESDSWSGRDSDCALRRDFDFRVDHIFGPVTAGWRGHGRGGGKMTGGERGER